jgi:outer membrane protein assembly factor BamB
MSGAGAPGHVGGEVQTILNVPHGGGGMREQPAVWVDPVEGSTWLFVANGQGLSGLQLGLDAANKPLLTARWTVTTSSNSPAVANGVLYVAGGCSGGTCVVARDPLTGSVLWTSPHIGNLHWQSPIVVDGAVYMTDGSRKLWKFGIVAGATHVVTPVAGSGGSIAPNTPQTVADGATTAFTLAPDAHFAIASVDGCGGTLDGTTYTTGAITDDCTVSASFAAITHVVTPLAGALYSVDPAAAQTVNEGDTFPFTINLVSGAYFIESVSGCDGNLVESVFTAGPVEADCSFTVNVGVAAADIVFDDGFEAAGR